MNLSSPHHTGVVHDRAIPSHLILRPTSIHFSHPLAALLISYSISCCGKHAMCELRVSGEQGRTILRGCEGIDHSLVQFDDYFIYMTYIYILYIHNISLDDIVWELAILAHKPHTSSEHFSGPFTRWCDGQLPLPSSQYCNQELEVGVPLGLPKVSKS
jgi:hypothetical protein